MIINWRKSFFTPKIIYKIGNQIKEKPMDKINWKLFGLKLWSSGIKDALDLIVKATDNPWDNATVEILDQIVIKVLPISEENQEE